MIPRQFEGDDDQRFFKTIPDWLLDKPSTYKVECARVHSQNKGSSFPFYCSAHTTKKHRISASKYAARLLAKHATEAPRTTNHTNQPGIEPSATKHEPMLSRANGA
jgi:hypothetical protein